MRFNIKSLSLLKASLIMGVLLVSQAFSQANSFLSYREMGLFQHTSPGAFRTGFYGVDNPAFLNYNNSVGESMFAFNLRNIDGRMEMMNYGLFYQTGNTSSAAIYTARDSHYVIDYRYNLAFGGPKMGLGFGYGFVGGNKSYFQRSNSFSWGMYTRPWSFLSLGLAQTYAIDNKDAESTIDVAIRPIPKYLLTFFADYNLNHRNSFRDGNWSVGANWEFLNGIRLSGRYFQNKGFSLSLDFSLRNMGIGSINHMSNNDQLNFNSSTAYFKFGGPDRTIFHDVKEEWVTVSLAGSLPYVTNKYFDDRADFLTMITYIDKLKDDKSVKGVVVDARKIGMASDKLWEVREAFRAIKESGKKVIIFLERSSIGGYYLASVADKLIMDPLGSIEITGMAVARSYYKSLFDKLGLGFEELRLYKYKSAVENFSRDEMSEGDREQRQRLLDSFYETMRADICKDRKLTPDQFDKLVNDRLLYSADEAKKAGLIDSTGRWENRKDMYAYFEGKEEGKANKSERHLFTRKGREPFDDKWAGESRTNIAVLYLEGACDMESGMKGRSNAKILKNLFENESIKAIVLRVDSPGGDPMAADYVTEIVKKNKGKKPVIISQGNYAASGGYWLSMDGDSIVSTPFTVTGSIGVISQFVYDKGLQDKLDIKTHVVQRGKHADLGRAWSLPFIGFGFPIRNMTPEERKEREEYIDILYKDFVNRVAAGRNMSFDSVHEVAQGRVWTGTDAKGLKLVDEVGGILKAIEIAKAKLNVKKDAKVNVYTYPEGELFDFDSFIGKLIPNLFNMNTKIKETAEQHKNMMYRLENNGKPLFMIDSDFDNIDEVIKK